MVRYQDIRSRIKDGDAAIFRNGGLISRVSSKYTHIGMLAWMRNRAGEPHKLLLIESREFRGARVIAFAYEVNRCPGRIDIFRPTCSQDICDLAVEHAVACTGNGYGYRGIGEIALRKMTLLRALGVLRVDRPYDTTPSPPEQRRHCSRDYIRHYRVAALECGSPWEMIRMMHEELVEPIHLVRSSELQLVEENGVAWEGITA